MPGRLRATAQRRHLSGSHRRLPCGWLETQVAHSCRHGILLRGSCNNLTSLLRIGDPILSGEISGLINSDTVGQRSLSRRQYELAVEQRSRDAEAAFHCLDVACFPAEIQFPAQERRERLNRMQALCRLPQHPAWREDSARLPEHGRYER